MIQYIFFSNYVSLHLISDIIKQGVPHIQVNNCMVSTAMVVVNLPATAMQRTDELDSKDGE